MTEAEWLACAAPESMRQLLRRTRSSRKRRMFAVACCRRVWTLLVDKRSQQALEIAEQFADGLASQADLSHGAAIAWRVLYEREFGDEYGKGRLIVSELAAAQAVECAVQERTDKTFKAHQRAAEAVEKEAWDHYSERCPLELQGAQSWGQFPKLMHENERKTQASYLRDIFGNPFRPVTLDPPWQTATVVALAEAIYAERAFDRLPILADALEEAGCTSAELLNHCRQPGEHVRGCWAVDLVLGKA